MIIKTAYGRNIVCEHIYPANQIVAGSVWQGSTGSLVTVDGVDANGWVHYHWKEVGSIRMHEKESFAFQCRYCLVVESQE